MASPRGSCGRRFAVSLADLYGQEVPAVHHPCGRLPRRERGLRRGARGRRRARSAPSTASPPSGTARSGWAPRASWPRSPGSSPASACSRSGSTTCATPRRARSRSCPPRSGPIDVDELARNPFRVFTSMLVTEDRRFFDAETQARLEAFIAARELFGPELLALADRAVEQGGLDEGDAERLLGLATDAFPLIRRADRPRLVRRRSRGSRPWPRTSAASPPPTSTTSRRACSTSTSCTCGCSPRDRHDRRDPGPARLGGPGRAAAPDLVPGPGRRADVPATRTAVFSAGCGSASARSSSAGSP